MVRKRIAVATINNNSLELYSNEIKSIFLDYIDLDKYCFEDGSIENGIEADIVLIPSYESFETIKVYLKNNAEIIVANRTITKRGLNKIVDLPKGTKAMLVNVSPETAVETISTIYQLGIKHIEFIPIYPGVKAIPDIDVAITPGEKKYVPKTVKKIFDIGSRVLDINTIINIAEKLDLEFLLSCQNTRDYFDSIVPLNCGLEKMIGKTHRLESQFDILLEILDEAIIGVNRNGRVYFYNDSAERIIGKSTNNVFGINLKNIFPQIPFDQVLSTLKPIKDKLVKISGVDFVVTIAPILKMNTLYGAVANIRRFSNTEKKQHKLRAQLIDKGHKAKYTFEDIIGNSKKIQNCKEIAKKIAKSDSSILITGESGTGKELFAQAIHNHSPRKSYPFVAVNCAALSENLLESELFGYEEGAFTGARKGGKLGLFELAHMGTLFLDEIAEMPLNLQARLLRVLQEKEVMRIGGDYIINVDVRIIAATNQNLEKLVNNRQFRQDLYYRLNVIPLQIPALRERKEDISPIIDEIKKDLNSNFKLTRDALNNLINYEWKGNIRELRNCIEYLTNIEEPIVDAKLLPLRYNMNNNKEALTQEEKILFNKFKALSADNIKEYFFILKQLRKCYINKTRLGRRSLERIAKDNGIFLTEHEIRNMLLILEKFSIVEIRKGRGGTQLTDFGFKVLYELQKG